MGTISSYMIGQHEHCDEAFARAEEAAHGGDWAGAERDLGVFLQEMDRHLAMEEKVLFPAFEERSGSASGPTEVMRMEHEQMRGLFAQLRDVLSAKDASQFLGLSETLLMLMQQHNMKEESVLYAMMDESMGDDADSLIARAEAVAST